MTRRALAQRGMLMAVGLVTASAALAGPAGAQSPRASAPVVDPTAILAAPCNVVSPSYCMLAWADADGTFTATGVRADGSSLVLDGTFSGQRSLPWPWADEPYVSVTGQAASVPVGSVGISRRTITFSGLNVPSDCGLVGVSCTEDTNPVRMTDTSQGAPILMEYRELPFTVTAHPSHSAGKHLGRDWRRARTAAARAALLQRLLFPSS